MDDSYKEPLSYSSIEKEDWAADLDERIYFLALAIEGKEELREIMTGKAINRGDVDFFLLQKMLQKLNLASLEVSAITSGLDCEEEKAEQLASFLERKVSIKERNLTVAAIITGAAISVVSGAILLAGESDKYIEIAAITGGLVEVWLGLKILRLEKKMAIEHKSNVLQMIRDQDNSQGIFPPSVWYYFNNAPSLEEVSLRDKLIERWDEFHDLPEDEFGVLFSDGGAYDAEMLDTRAELLDQLGAQITLMQQDILRFQRFLLNH
ncbi:hypothetical protein [Anditalea andensis]|uniref:hypothetical protein n=1 Tax=Anditalea andensis TaxID=1048983 RepID=UPI0013DF9514|nr:hypothetical protein [Anditalea andensis]